MTTKIDLVTPQLFTFPTRTLAVGLTCLVMAIALAAMGGSHLLGASWNAPRITVLAGSGLLGIGALFSFIVVHKYRQMYEFEKVAITLQKAKTQQERKDWSGLQHVNWSKKELQIVLENYPNTISALYAHGIVNETNLSLIWKCSNREAILNQLFTFNGFFEFEVRKLCTFFEDSKRLDLSEKALLNLFDELAYGLKQYDVLLKDKSKLLYDAFIAQIILSTHKPELKTKFLQNEHKNGRLPKILSPYDPLNEMKIVSNKLLLNIENPSILHLILTDNNLGDIKLLQWAVETYPKIKDHEACVKWEDENTIKTIDLSPRGMSVMFLRKIDYFRQIQATLA